ncbi:hypothetical protein G7Z17_g8927 [Cylindrodendrum hubeiense]|uniref:Fungal N-terminal domain-containing protein n=1 Tax=Cylindrodendrum hubeiense TaxID=595255 RepID=A0A9P5H4B0_9HYPO|nr:hypothetical protein G7Z17_g8927 [Cylindrodendrum hubeiense]
MDPLSIFGAVTGGISVTSEIFKALEKAISIASKVKEAPELAVSTLRDVGMMRHNMLRFQQLLDSEALARERGLYIPLDDAQNTFTDCVTSLDELESLLKPLSDPGLQSLAMSERLEWAMKDKRINELSKRVRDAQSSLGLMLTILQHESLIEVHKAIAGLSEICQRIAPNVAHLNRRSFSTYPTSRRIWDEADDSSTIRPAAVPRPDSVIVPETVPEEDLDNSQARASTAFNARFAFEEALEASRPYRRAPNWDCEDLSYRSSVLNPHALSLLSKLSSLSLGDVSTISVIALPLFCNDISNPQHYTFGETALGYTHALNTGAQITDNTVIEPELKQSHHPWPPTPRSSAPSTPQSPSLPGRVGVSRIFKAVRRAFDSEILEISTPFSPVSSYMPPSPVTLLDYSDIVTGKSNLLASQKYPSLEQLSSWRLEDIEEEQSVEEIRRWQLNLAAANGFLDAFRCQKCSMSLKDIIQTKRSDWESLELWCGSRTCLGVHPELRPCSCYTKIQQLRLPADKYMGCRRVFDDKVECARCFNLCPGCSANKPSGTEDVIVPSKVEDETPASRAEDETLRYWNLRATSGDLYVRQERLLKIQRNLIDNIDKRSSAREGKLGYAILQLESLIRVFEREEITSKEVIAVLKARQAVLVMREEMLPAWKEMSAYVENGSGFWSMALENMRVRINQSQELLDELAKTNRVWDPYPHLSNRSSDPENGPNARKPPPKLYGSFLLTAERSVKIGIPEPAIGIAI